MIGMTDVKIVLISPGGAHGLDKVMDAKRLSARIHDSRCWEGTCCWYQ